MRRIRSVLSRYPLIRSTGPEVSWIVWTVLLSVVVLWLATGRLGSFPRVSGDDAWIMSASHKLANDGAFGSDLYRGFANAEQHYFIALPAYHLLQAFVFMFLETSVTSARAVTLGSGLVVLWSTSWLARRWFGISIAVVVAGLLAVWRASLLGLASGLSFISASRTGRYDMTAVAFLMLALVGIDLVIERGDWRLAFGTGALAGLATLTQFFGLFAFPLVIVILLVDCGWHAYREPIARWLAAGWLAVVAPYGAYVAAHWADFARQSELKSGRIDFARPGFFLDNLLDEPDRYRHLFSDVQPLLDGDYDRFDQPLSPFLFGCAALLALGLLARRNLRRPTRGERRLALSIALPAILLALSDGTNAPLYAVVIFPFLTLAIAVLIVEALRWSVRQAPAAFGVAAAMLTITTLVIVVEEGVVAHRQEREWSSQIVSYREASDEIEALLPAGMPVLGEDRWWPGLQQDHEYIALSAIALQVDQEGSQDEVRDQLADLIDRFGIAAIIIGDDGRGTISRMPYQVNLAFDSFLEDAAVRAGSMAIHPYGQIDVYRLDEWVVRRSLHGS